MKLPVDFELEAIDDVDSAFVWNENERTGLGEEFLNELLEQLDRIQENPEAYAVLYRKVRASSMQRFSYVIYYRILPDRINVVAVQHGHRNPRAWRRRV